MNKFILQRETDVYARTGDKGLLLGSASPMVFEMNQLACEIWELIDGKRTTDDIAEEIIPRYLGISPKTVRQDIINYIQELHKHRLIMFEEMNVDEL